MKKAAEYRKGYNFGEKKVVSECVECGTEMWDQRDSLMYECERCINQKEE